MTDSSASAPRLSAPALSAAAPVVSKEPWLKWPPDRKVWAAGAAGVLSWLLLSLLAHFGIDVQGVADVLSPFLLGQHIDVAGTLVGLITFAVAHYTSPSIQDVVDRVNNMIIRIANADPGNPTTAVVVDAQTSDEAAVRDMTAGLIPPDVAAKSIAAKQ